MLRFIIIIVLFLLLFIFLNIKLIIVINMINYILMNKDFERKSALFTLAISEVLVINIWENMVGLYQGANMGLLKTVFEVNMQLFLQQQG